MIHNKSLKHVTSIHARKIPTYQSTQNRLSTHHHQYSFFNTTTYNLQKNKSNLKTDQNQGYKLSVRQKKALKLVNDQNNQKKNPPTSSSSAVDVNYDELTDISKALQALKEQAEIQEMEAYETKPQPWYNLLTFPSRALWRSSPKSPPSYLTDAQADIMKRSERTSKQLRRTIENIVKNHAALSEKRERERRDLANGKRSPGADTSLATKAKKASENKIKPVYYNPEQTVSSLKYRLVPNYHITKRVLREVQGLIGRENFKPRKVLDVGIGVGSSSAALLDHSLERFMRENKISDNNDDGNEDGNEIEIGLKPSYTYDGVEWIHGIEPSTSMRDGATLVLSSVIEGQQKEIIEAESNGSISRIPRKPRITLGETLSPTQERNILQSRGTYDLALCSYTLCEIPSVPANLSLVAMIWEKLSPNGIAIFIEPGTPDGFNSLRSVRSMLLDCCPPSSEDGDAGDNEKGDEECHIVAPCTHNGTCPMIRHKRNFSKKSKMMPMDETVTMDGDVDEDEENFDDGWTEEEINEDDEDEDDNEDDFDEDILENIDSLDRSEAGAEKSATTDAFDSAFCSFVHGLPGGEGGKGGEKFSYLVVQKRITGEYQRNVSENDPFKDVNITDLLTASIKTGGADARRQGSRARKERPRNDDMLEEILEEAVDIERTYLHSEEDLLGLELVKGKYNSWGRIIRAPIKKKGHVIVDYCTSSQEVDEDDVEDERTVERGKIIRRTVTRSHSDRGAPGMYMASRKSRWGGLWPDL